MGHDLMNPRVLWRVSLSNGENLQENSGIYKWKPQKRSPWLDLISYCGKNELEMTSLSLVSDKGLTWNLPSAGKNPKFSKLANIPKPLGYHVERSISRDMYMKGKTVSDINITEWYTIGKAIYPEFELQIWVNEFDHKKSWSIFVPTV